MSGNDGRRGGVESLCSPSVLIGGDYSPPEIERLCALDSGVVSDEETALGWRSNILALLRRPPDLTVYVDAPLDVRVRRIEGADEVAQVIRERLSRAASSEGP
jgi:hypothetical protein